MTGLKGGCVGKEAKTRIEKFSNRGGGNKLGKGRAPKASGEAVVNPEWATKKAYTKDGWVWWASL